MPPRTIHSAAFMSVLSFQQTGDFQDGVHIVLAVIIVVDDLEGLVAVDAGFPAVVLQVAGDAEDGVGIHEEVDPAVAIAVLPVGEDVAGHELGDAQGAGV